MTTPGKNTVPAKTRQGTKPEWENLPRRHCDNCGARYKPSRPNSRFCCDNCRKQFNKNSGAFTKLKELIGKEIKKQMSIMTTCPACRGTAHHKARKHAGPCQAPDCMQGMTLTSYGRQVVEMFSRYLRCLAPAERSRLLGEPDERPEANTASTAN